ncbi:MAG: hypothetical protein M1818_003878 [Claussenomyces sp. TS43310]|nr:MAG: hypothetical protein M1818_003878 [Claussenomyces sp. TS43310]
MVIEMESEAGSLLRAPSDQIDPPIERLQSLYKPFDTFSLEKAKHYQQQYGDMYFLRLTKLKPAAEKNAAEAWEGFQIAGEEARKVERVLDVRQGELCWVTGTIYMELPLKPNILEDISKDHWISAPPPREKYLSADGGDLTMLEDESGRLRLIGSQLANEMLVTGCIVSVLGTENANGDFDVIDIKVPDLPPQPPRWAIAGPPSESNGSSRKVKRQKIEDDEDVPESVPSGAGGKIAIVSGLGITGTSTEHSLQIELLVEFLLGEALDSEIQRNVAKISRLFIAGNSLSPENDPISQVIDANTRNKKKYGYDSSAYNPAPTAHLDNLLAALLPSIPITLIPGSADPANVSLPQQPLHPAMLPHARAYAAPPHSAATEQGQPGWFDAVTNPWDGEVDGWRVLGTGGQNVDDVFKYVEGEDRLGSYPFQDDDPFVLNQCPHLFFVGSQPKFDTAVIEGPEGQMVRLIAVPRFSETGEIVLVDSETLDVQRVAIGIFEHDR